MSSYRFVNYAWDDAKAASLDPVGRLVYRSNILGSDQQDVSRHFAVSSSTKFADFDYDPGLGGCPLIPGSIARFECRVENIIPGGDHMIFIGRVERAGYRAGEPLLFHAGTYCVLKPIDRTVPLMPEMAALYELSIETSHFF